MRTRVIIKIDYYYFSYLFQGEWWEVHGLLHCILVV